MNSPPRAHYLLFAEASICGSQGPAWRFVLEEVTSGHAFAATDVEPAECRERLELLAVVRGLEAIDQPAKVTLVTRSRYVSRGFKRGLSEWRNNSWHWERFGRVVPVRDHDLWRRIDRALSFHQVDCRTWQFDLEGAAEVDSVAAQSESPAALEVAVLPPIATPSRRGLAAAAKEQLQRASRAAATLGDALRPAGLAAG